MRHKKNKSGSVMILTLCVVMVLSILSLTLLKTSSDLVRFYKRSEDAEQCEMLASSIAKLLKQQMEENQLEKLEILRTEDMEDWKTPVYYDLEDSEFPGTVSLKIEKEPASDCFQVTVFCEMDDVSKQISWWYEPEDSESEDEELEHLESVEIME
ncbi:MAG: hypothetical protein ACI39W_09655 [Brotaphodocola sp.]